MVNRQVVTELAVMHACGEAPEQAAELADLWCYVVLPQMPSSQTNLLAGNLKVLLETVSEHASEGAAKAFKTALMQLVETARRSEAATRIAEMIDSIAVETADWAMENFTQFNADRRAGYRDVRLVLGNILSLLPAGPAGVNGHLLRDYLARYLLPNLPFNANILRQIYERASRHLEEHLTPDDARLMNGYFSEAIHCFERHSRLHPLLAAADRMSITPVERGYQAAPRHESLQREGIKAGRRDGKFLISRAIHAAIVGGEVAEQNFHRQFREEQVRLSKLPGTVLVEFIRGFLEQVRDYPEITELLLGLAYAAPLYAAATKINAHSSDWGSTLSERTVAKYPTYRDQIGAHGLDACKRDNSVMLRGLAHHLAHAPVDTNEFKSWWKRTIGKHIRSQPEHFDSAGICSKSNIDEIIGVLRQHLDPEESNAVENYLVQLYDPRGSGTASSGAANGGSRVRRLPLNLQMPTVSFSDVGV